MAAQEELRAVQAGIHCRVLLLKRASIDIFDKSKFQQFKCKFINLFFMCQGFWGFGVFGVFGPIGVLGVGLLLTHGVDTAWLWIALFSGCMSVAVLNLNNLRDHASDALADKHTVVVRLGFRRAKLYHLAVLGVGWSALALFFNTTQAEGVWRGTMWYALLALLHARHAVDVWRCTDPSTLDPELKRIALSTFLVALFMFMDQTLGA